MATALEMMKARGHHVGFAQRTRRNLDFLLQHHTGGEESPVHVVTQIVNSLLGLVVFPWERDALAQLRRHRLADLHSQGWPSWSMSGAQCQDLGTLVKFLRNGVAHGAVLFDSDSRDMTEVTITIRNHQRAGRNDKAFSASIRADQLLEFCRRLSDAIESAVGAVTPPF